MQMRCPRKPPTLPPPPDAAVRWEQCGTAQRRGPLRRVGEAEVDEGTGRTDMRRDKHMNNEAEKPPLAVRFSGPPPFSLPSFSPRYRHHPHPPTLLSLPSSTPASHLLYLRALFPLRLLPFFFFYLGLFTAVVPPSIPLCLRKRQKNKTKKNSQCFDKVFVQSA